ncbi:MAG: TetR/AcrR family transcriptional regulator [Gammaproteobacteria bacterium]|nr:TetR/AcrR family transcriptional regulator [Gammaproteobacteria bacterium]
MTDVNSNPELGLRARKKQQTHKRICDAAVALFVERGFNETTVEAIALKADVSKPTLFNYFSSKLAILHELIETIDTQFVQFIDEALNSEASTEARLQKIMLRSANNVCEQPAFTRLTLVEGLGAIGESDATRSRFARLHSAMATLLEAGVEQNDVRTDYSIELMVQMLVGGYLYAILAWLNNQDKSLKKAMRDTASFLAEAVAPR